MPLSVFKACILIPHNIMMIHNCRAGEEQSVSRKALAGTAEDREPAHVAARRQERAALVPPAHADHASLIGARAGAAAAPPG
jgi:hypothetical protein